MDITGSSAIVTGAASGIGAAVARQLAAAGATVVVADLNAEKGEALAQEIGGAFVAVDVTDTEQIKAAVRKAVELGPLRILVNSAGIGWAQRTIGRDGAFDSAHDLGAFTKVIAINLIGTFDAIRLAATEMSKLDPTESGERGAIVNMASVAAFDGQIGQASYSASKGGVVGMTLPVARDLSASAIRVNTIAPGLIDTPIYGEGDDAEAFKAKLGESVLFPKRLGVPDELASMVLECIRNTYMNGETIRVDGGIRMPPEVAGRRVGCDPRPAGDRCTSSATATADKCTKCPTGGTGGLEGRQARRGAAPSQAVRSSTRSARAAAASTSARVGLVDPLDPRPGGVGGLAELHVPGDQPLPPYDVVDAHVPHRVELARAPPATAARPAAGSCPRSPPARPRAAPGSPRRAAAPARARTPAPPRRGPGRARSRARRSAYPQASKVSGAPFRSRSPRRTSSTSARWKPSIGTTTAPARAATAAASVDFPAPGAPVIPSRNRPP